MFSLFFSVWTNPNTKIYQIVKYLLSSSADNSTTWAVNMRHISRQYNLEDPLACLNRDPPTKSKYSENIITRIYAFHENELRKLSENNSKMEFLNVNLAGLRGRHHPALADIVTVDEVKKSRPHLKFLTGDYLTYQMKFDQSGAGSPLCRICRSDNETICHIISICPQYSETRTRIFEELEELCLLAKTKINFKQIVKDPKTSTQFILDPISFNLSNRIHNKDPLLPQFFKLSRAICYSIHNERIKGLQNLSKTETTK